MAKTKRSRKASNQAYSAGARYERKALRAKLRRLISDPVLDGVEERWAFQHILDWVLTRERRYSRHKGGL